MTDPLAYDSGAVPWEENRSKRLRTGQNPQSLFFSSSAGFFCFWGYDIIREDDWKVSSRSNFEIFDNRQIGISVGMER